MRGEGTRRGRRWIVWTILALLVALPASALISGTSVLVVRNEVGADADITVFLGPQPIGAGRIAAGDSTWYLFTPHTQQDEDFAVGCRVDSLAANRIAHVGYVPGTARLYRIAVGPCGHIRSYGTSWSF